MNQQIRSSSTSGEETDYFGAIPFHLVMSKILSRLPVKSIGQFRCVSKLWSSRIRSSSNNLLFPIKFSAPPRILFTIDYDGDMLFYTSPQPHNPDENSSLVATLHHRTRNTKFYDICAPVCGLVCRQYHSEVVIVNSITGESLKLPNLSLDKSELCLDKSEWLFVKARYALGYDPIDKQFKVLCITWLRSGSLHLSDEYQVLTLEDGNQNLVWRKIQCFTIHYSLKDSAICIDGVLYYPAEIYKGVHTIVCFDVRSEKFSFTNIDQDMAVKIKSPTFSLIDYKGKLGACNFEIFNYNLLELWVLEDAKKYEWSKHSYQISHPWLDKTNHVHIAGMIGSCEIVLYPRFEQDIFIFYYNLETNILTGVRLELPLSKKFRMRAIYAFPNFVEYVKFM